MPRTTPARISTPRAVRVPRLYDVVARALLALPFLASGVSRVLEPRPFVETISGAGLVFAREVNLVSAAIELAGGLCLVLGVRVWVAAIVLAFYVLPFAFVLHGLPAQENPAEGARLARELALAGGLLLLAGMHRQDPRGAAPRVPAARGETAPPDR